MTTGGGRNPSDGQGHVRAQRLHHMLESSDDGLWDWRLDTGEMFVSRGWQRMLGYAASPELDGRAIMRLHGHPDDDARLRPLFDAVYRGERDAYQAELRLRTLAGDWRWILTRARVVERDADGRALRLIGVNHDVTDTRRISRALRTSESRLRDTLDGLPIAVALVGPDGASLHHNPAFGRLSGLSGDALYALDIRALPWPIFDESGRRVTFPAHGVFAPWVDGRASRGVVLAHFPVGADEPVWTLSDFVPHFGPDHTLRHVVCSFADITLLRRITAGLMRTQRFEGLAHLAGAVAHDFNNLLATVLGSAEVVGIGLAADSPFREDLDRIIAAAQQGAALTHQLMGYARRQPGLPRVVDLGARLELMRETLARLLGRRVALTIEPPREPLHVVIDPTQFEQLVSNLIVNAREAMPDGGQVRIELDVAPHLSSADNRPMVVLRISDDGEGIASDVLPHIFDPMFTTRRLETGAGLGLATCEGIARQNGGHIAVDSRIGRGTIFEVALPRARGDAGESEDRPPGPPQTERAVALVVETDPHLRALACTALERRGHRVLMAPTARTAAAAATRVDVLSVLITADTLPDGDGPTLARAVAEHHPGARVLYVSNPAQHPTLDTRVWGDASFIFRPFGTAELCARVDALLTSALSRR